jgi:hypothetical protein
MRGRGVPFTLRASSKELAYMTFPKRLASALLASAAALAVSAPSLAGPIHSPTIAYCNKAADGSGWCWGGYPGFKSTGGSLQLTQTLTQFTFYGTVSGQTGTCTATPSTITSTAMTTMAQNAFLQVGWNAAGQCTYIANEVASSF